MATYNNGSVVQCMRQYEMFANSLNLVKNNEVISSLIEEKELNSLFDYEYYLKNVDTIYKRVGL